MVLIFMSSGFMYGQSTRPWKLYARVFDSFTYQKVDSVSVEIMDRDSTVLHRLLKGDAVRYGWWNYYDSIGFSGKRKNNIYRGSFLRRLSRKHWTIATRANDETDTVTKQRQRKNFGSPCKSTARNDCRVWLWRVFNALARTYERQVIMYEKKGLEKSSKPFFVVTTKHLGRQYRREAVLHNRWLSKHDGQVHY